MTDQHRVFFSCMESMVEDRVIHHDRCINIIVVLLAHPVPDGILLVELLDALYQGKNIKGVRPPFFQLFSSTVILLGFFLSKT